MIQHSDTGQLAVDKYSRYSVSPSRLPILEHDMLIMCLYIAGHCQSAVPAVSDPDVRPPLGRDFRRHPPRPLRHVHQYPLCARLLASRVSVLPPEPSRCSRGKDKAVVGNRSVCRYAAHCESLASVVGVVFLLLYPDITVTILCGKEHQERRTRRLADLLMNLVKIFLSVHQVARIGQDTGSSSTSTVDPLFISAYVRSDLQRMFPVLEVYKGLVAPDARAECAGVLDFFRSLIVFPDKDKTALRGTQFLDFVVKEGSFVPWWVCEAQTSADDAVIGIDPCIELPRDQLRCCDRVGTPSSPGKLFQGCAGQLIVTCLPLLLPAVSLGQVLLREWVKLLRKHSGTLAPASL